MSATLALPVKKVQVGCSMGCPYLSIDLERTLESTEVRETFERLRNKFDDAVSCDFIDENINISPTKGYFQSEDYPTILELLGLAGWIDKILIGPTPG